MWDVYLSCQTQHFLLYAVHLKISFACHHLCPADLPAHPMQHRTAHTPSLIQPIVPRETFRMVCCRSEALQACKYLKTNNHGRKISGTVPLLQETAQLSAGLGHRTESCSMSNCARCTTHAKAISVSRCVLLLINTAHLAP